MTVHIRRNIINRTFNEFLFYFVGNAETAYFNSNVLYCLFVISITASNGCMFALTKKYDFKMQYLFDIYLKNFKKY